MTANQNDAELKKLGQESRQLLIRLAVAFACGGVLGALLSLEPLHGIRSYVVPMAGAFGGLFVTLLTLWVHPLVASSVWSAISKNLNSIGIALVAVMWFALTTCVALFAGAVVFHVLKPGVGLDLLAEMPSENVPDWYQSLVAFIKQPVDVPWTDAGLVVIIGFFAAKAFLFVPFFPGATRDLDTMFEIMQRKCMDWMVIILKALPFAVFCLALSLVGKHGPGFLFTKVSLFLLADIGGLFFHQLLVLTIGFTFMGKAVFRFVRTIIPAIVVAFGTRSSVGTMQTTFRCMDTFGVPRSISNFTLPFGATVNMDGTCLHIMGCLIVMLQSKGVDLTPGMVMQMAGTVMMASVATAAVPGASVALLKNVAVSAITGLGLGLSAEEIGLMIGFFIALDFVTDMFRTQCNVWGDCFANLFLKWFFEKDWMSYPSVRTATALPRAAFRACQPWIDKLPMNQQRTESQE